jgi:D-alanyl-D-alanine dipeptidase
MERAEAHMNIWNDKTALRKSGILSATVLLAAGAALSAARQAIEKPLGCDPCRKSELVEIVGLDPTIRLDIRYATADNFVGRPVYPEARAFLQRPAAEALLAVQRRLRKKGLGLVVYDAYRPWSVTRLFWEITPPEKRMYVADPARGSNHNRGCAVDVGLVELAGGRVLEMPGAYDEMSGRSHVDYAGGTPQQRANRDLLRLEMERDGLFQVYPEEWWHYDFGEYRAYPVLDVSLEELGARGESPR